MNNEERILSLLEVLVKGQEQTNQRLDKVDIALAETKADVNELKADVNGLKADVNGLKADVNGIKTDIDDLKSEISDIKNRIVSIEHDTGERLDALFDGYKLLYDISDEVRTDITKLRSSNDKQDFIIKWLSLDKKKQNI